MSLQAEVATNLKSSQSDGDNNHQNTTPFNFNGG